MESNNAIEQIREKRLIFTVTTGRSGTAYLASIFGFAKKVYAVHEPVPEFADVLRATQGRPSLARQFLIEKKLPAILNVSSDIYVETSHLVCKGFLEPLLELDIIPDLIVHRRPPRDVALSMYKMGTIPGRSDKGLRFYLSPTDPGVLKLSDWQDLHDYQLCYWYCLEIERRARYYQKKFSQYGARIAETTLQELKTFSGLKKCISDLDLELKFPAWLTRLRFFKSADVKVNESKETKREVTAPLELTELEQEVVNRIDNLELYEWVSEMSKGVL